MSWVDDLKKSVSNVFSGQKKQPELRPDGTPKGLGYFGPLKRPDGRVSTELSIGVDFDGEETLIPSLVPTLDDGEVKYLLGGGKPTKQIVDKAVLHARKRMRDGKNPFAQEGEQPPPPSPRSPYPSIADPSNVSGVL
jgi:hypothetical protein